MIEIPNIVLQGMKGLPGIGLQEITDLMSKFIICSLRIGAFIIAAPFFGGASVPLHVRIIFTSLIGILILNFVPIPSFQDFSNLQILKVVIVEISIGLFSGLIMSIWFAAAVLAGEKIAHSSALGYAAQVDPVSGMQSPVIAMIFSMLLTICFLTLDGHLVVLRLIIESYQYIPIGMMPLFGPMINGGIEAAKSMFYIAALIMLPVAIAMLLINTVVGVITRSAPTLNLFSFAFPLTIFAVFVIIYFSLNSISLTLSDLIDATINNVKFVLEEASNG